MMVPEEEHKQLLTQSLDSVTVLTAGGKCLTHVSYSKRCMQLNVYIYRLCVLCIKSV